MPAPEYRWGHVALLISILLLFIVVPFVVPLHHGILVMNLISAAGLVAGSYALSERKHFAPLRSCYRQSPSPAPDCSSLSRNPEHVSDSGA